MKELLGKLYSTQSVPRCYKQNNPRVLVAVKQSATSKKVNTEVVGITALEAISRKRLLKPQQTEKTVYLL